MSTALLFIKIFSTEENYYSFQVLIPILGLCMIAIFLYKTRNFEHILFDRPTVLMQIVLIFVILSFMLDTRAGLEDDKLFPLSFCLFIPFGIAWVPSAFGNFSFPMTLLMGYILFGKLMPDFLVITHSVFLTQCSIGIIIATIFVTFIHFGKTITQT